MRVLRIFKLARIWKNFGIILAKIVVTLKNISIFSLLLLIFMFISSLLGMELFGHKVKFNNLDRYVDPQVNDIGVSPRPNFDNLGMGFTSVFAISIGDDWNVLMSKAYRAEGFIAIAFYIVVFIFMNLTLLNLFLAILLQNFEEKDDDSTDDVSEEK